VARVDPRSSHRIGEEVEMVFNMDNFHIFDAQSELAVK
jgi:hypothetical protein